MLACAAAACAAYRAQPILLFGLEFQPVGQFPKLCSCVRTAARHMAGDAAHTMLPTFAGVSCICLLSFVAQPQTSSPVQSAASNAMAHGSADADVAMHAVHAEADIGDAAKLFPSGYKMRWQWEMDGDRMDVTGKNSAAYRRQRAADENGDVWNDMTANYHFFPRLPVYKSGWHALCDAYRCVQLR